MTPETTQTTIQLVEKELAIFTYLIPSIIIITLIILGITSYVKKHGLSLKTVVTIVDILAKNKSIKNAIQCGIDLASEKLSSNSVTKEECIAAVKEFVAQYIKDVLNYVSDDESNYTDDEREIFLLLSKYRIHISDINMICDMIIKVLGYDDEKIEQLISERLQVKSAIKENKSEENDK